MALQHETRRQFSVVARLRRGEPCSLGAFSIVMEITNQLHQYQNLFNIAFSPPNYIIYTVTGLHIDHQELDQDVGHGHRQPALHRPHQEPYEHSRTTMKEHTSGEPKQTHLPRLLTIQDCNQII